VELDAREDLVGMAAEHDDGVAHPLRRGHREQRVLQQRPAVEQGELFGRAEPPPAAGGQHQPADPRRRSGIIGRRCSGRGRVAGCKRRGTSIGAAH